jgi:hypothetical protein
VGYEGPFVVDLGPATLDGGAVKTRGKMERWLTFIEDIGRHEGEESPSRAGCTIADRAAGFTS